MKAKVKLKLATVPDEKTQAWLSDQLHKCDLKATEDRKQNPMVGVYGAGPARVKCKTCAHLVANRRAKRTYYKCELRGVTNGPKTDHLVNWPACSKYEAQKELFPK